MLFENGMTKADISAKVEEIGTKLEFESWIDHVINAVEAYMTEINKRRREVEYKAVSERVKKAVSEGKIADESDRKLFANYSVSDTFRIDKCPSDKMQKTVSSIKVYGYSGALIQYHCDKDYVICLDEVPENETPEHKAERVRERAERYNALWHDCRCYIAHELGHLVLYYGLAKDKEEWDKLSDEGKFRVETEASYFAECILKNRIEDVFKEETVKRYKVSEDFYQKRLNDKMLGGYRSELIPE